MSLQSKKATIYLEPDIHKVLKSTASTAGTTISKLVNQALRLSFVEDALDLAAIDARKDEPSRPFTEFIHDLKENGLL